MTFFQKRDYDSEAKQETLDKIEKGTLVDDVSQKDQYLAKASRELKPKKD